MSFVNSLATGEKAQVAFAKYLLETEKVISLEFAQGKFKDWDIKIMTKEGEKTYEVKSDCKSEYTGNFCIECRYKGEPSGIYASKADYIVYYTDKKWWIQDRGELILRLIDTEKEVKKGGDGKWSQLYVMPCSTLPNLFNSIDIPDGQNRKETQSGEEAGDDAG